MKKLLKKATLMRLPESRPQNVSPEKTSGEYLQEISCSCGSLVIRPMRWEDLDQVIHLESSSFPYPWKRGSFEMELKYNQRADYLVACWGSSQGELVAYAGMWFLKGKAHMTTLAVDPDYRKCRVGEQFLQHLKERARTRGMKRMTLEVRPSNRAALKLYRKQGFKFLQVLPRYYKDEHALMMEVGLDHP